MAGFHERRVPEGRHHHGKHVWRLAWPPETLTLIFSKDPARQTPGGDLFTWYDEGLAGIKAVEPGFSFIVMRLVEAGGLNSVHTSYQSPYGLIRSDGRKDDG